MLNAGIELEMAPLDAVITVHEEMGVFFLPGFRFANPVAPPLPHHYI
jgi:hypothetical protein